MKLRLNSIFLVLVGLISVQCSNTSDKFTISGESSATIFITPQEPDYVHLAVDDLIEDVEQITGTTLKTVTSLSECTKNCIVIGTASDTTIQNMIDKERISTLEDAWEKYAIFSTNDSGQNRLNIVGSSPRGTMFGIYHFLEEQLGVDPLKFWTGYEPEKKEKIELDDIDYVSEEPDFKFRGWFINDEDLLTEWKDGGGKRNIDYRYYDQVVSPDVMAEVVEAAVRLRYNLIIPASFMDIRNPDEEALLREASKRGLYLSMHHIEPVGVSGFGYQNYWEEKGEEPLFSFYSERNKLEQTWRDYAEMWSKYPDVIWQVGLRGIADRPMWLADPGIPQSDEERGKLISDAIKLQREIIQEVTGNKNPLMTTTLWAEGSYFFQKGFLEVPEDVIIVFSDNSPGWVWQPDFYETERIPDRRYGVYYHHQLWGAGPHLAQGVPPKKTYKMFKRAVEHDSQDYLIMNVSNIREFILGIEASTAMLWDFDSFNMETFLKDWCSERFPEAAEETYSAYRQFFDSYHLSGEKQLPVYLDGLQKSRGMEVLNFLEKSLKNTVKEKSEWDGVNRKEDPFLKSLSDAHPRAEGNLENQLAQLERQLDGLKKTLQLAEKPLELLSGKEQDFFESNLLAQAKILYGIGGWLKGCIKAQIALEQENSIEQAHENLVEALSALDNVQAGKEAASKGKWDDWYRGDKKMNMDYVRERTGKVKNLIAERL